jgi:hypothetical protein
MGDILSQMYNAQCVHQEQLSEFGAACELLLPLRFLPEVERLLQKKIIETMNVS